MSVPSDPVQIGGISVTAPTHAGGVPGAAAHGVGGVGGALAFTGTGPGTLPLAIAGLLSILGGAVCVLLGRESTGRRAKGDDGLIDLSSLVD
jgi:hypothetical protein